ncbi:MAG: TetR/AcrR family transcriptional regulator [Bdellovibrionales bacterium]|nr:TetR/AcrR family transcriptional regulator [Bdellovibrionales bacterium]
MKNSSTKEDIIFNADQLFYEQGYEKTSFADIASKVNISKGNFYHHFKTKDDLLKAVIEYRLNNTEKMLMDWQIKGKTPTERIQSFIKILIRNRKKIKLYGCPVGTLSSELNKLEHSSKKEANRLFDLFRDWLKVQFLELGHQEDADRLAMHILARSQGVAVLANAYQDETFVDYEVDLLVKWVDNLNNLTKVKV